MTSKIGYGRILFGVTIGFIFGWWGGTAEAHEIPRTRDATIVVCSAPSVLLPADEDGEWHDHRLEDCLTELEWVNRGRHIPPKISEKCCEESATRSPIRGNAPITAGVEQWRGLVEAYFNPADVPWALRVMACESGGNPNAYNASSATGLFQIKTFWTKDYPGNLYDPAHNVATAAAIFYTYGPSHWVCR